jgi:hypothetical protein
VAAVARVMQVTSQALYHIARPRTAPQRCPPAEARVEAAIVEQPKPDRPLPDGERLGQAQARPGVDRERVLRDARSQANRAPPAPLTRILPRRAPGVAVDVHMTRSGRRLRVLLSDGDDRLLHARDRAAGASRPGAERLSRCPGSSGRSPARRSRPARPRARRTIPSHERGATRSPRAHRPSIASPVMARFSPRDGSADPGDDAAVLAVARLDAKVALQERGRCQRRAARRGDCKVPGVIYMVIGAPVRARPAPGLKLAAYRRGPLNREQ